MPCTTKDLFEIPIPIPETRASMCRQEHTISIGGYRHRVSYDVPCVQTRTCDYTAQMEVCYPSENELTDTAKKVLGAAILAGIAGAVAAELAIPEPTAVEATKGFETGFNGYLLTQSDEIKNQLLNKVTTHVKLDSTCGNWH